MKTQHLLPLKASSHQAHNLKINSLHLVFAQRGMDEAQPNKTGTGAGVEPATRGAGDG